jgi:methylthioribulose-1-phosphate dehydratase
VTSILDYSQVGVSLEKIQAVFDQLRGVKEVFAGRGWFPATSGNLSLRVEGENGDTLAAVTASGKDKAVHTPEDFLVVDLEGKPTLPTHLKPSAETLVHTALYRKWSDCRAVFHVHTVANNLVSDRCFEAGGVTFARHELIKALGVWEEGASITVPIVENDADIRRLAHAVEKAADARVPGVLIRNHGIYVWGDSAFSAKRHLEAFEFLFEYQVQQWMLEHRR